MYGILSVVSAIVIFATAIGYEVPADNDKSAGPFLSVLVLFGLIFMWATFNWMGIQWAS